MTPRGPILTGITVASLRSRFLAAGGTIEQHKGDDRWRAIGFKPVRVHSGRTDASRQLIRLVRLVEAGRPEFSRVISPAEIEEDPMIEAAMETLIRHRPLPGLARPRPHTLVVQVTPEQEEAERAVAAQLAALKGGDPETIEAREKRGKFRAQMRRADVIVGIFEERALVFYGWALVQKTREDLAKIADKFVPIKVVLKFLRRQGYTLLFVEMPDRRTVDRMNQEVGMVRGRSDLLPTNEWPEDWTASE